MLKKWKEWWAVYRAVIKQDLYRRGYDYAAGALLRKEETPRTLEARQGQDKNAFDAGMNMAIFDLVRLKAVEDDLI